MAEGEKVVGFVWHEANRRRGLACLPSGWLAGPGWLAKPRHGWLWPAPSPKPRLKE